MVVSRKVHNVQTDAFIEILMKIFSVYVSRAYLSTNNKIVEIVLITILAPDKTKSGASFFQFPSSDL